MCNAVYHVLWSCEDGPGGPKLWPSWGKRVLWSSFTRCHHTIPYSTISYHTISYHTIWYHTISYHTISYHVISYHNIPYRTEPYHTIPYHTMLYHIIPYHTIQYHHTSPSYPTIHLCLLQPRLAQSGQKWVETHFTIFAAGGVVCNIFICQTTNAWSFRKDRCGGAHINKGPLWTFIWLMVMLPRLPAFDAQPIS